ncbi:tRNA (adenosine(37)-N6)-threonylcarbamoyltransferase complex transferase subunit TsaD [Candidatus Shapirobacteria bacterium]|nr:tRNA (adenosine(37)-N6)-threonylcarbamoyltransferase complex transferase subunit TsaD [Candidatus Shapirobacteria bacterium]
MRILAIETSCDDTCASVLENDRVLSHVISSQTDLHKEWGGVVPDIAKRAHQARIRAVIAEAIKRSKIYDLRFKNKTRTTEERIEKIIDKGMKFIDVIAVTKGPGLAIALSVGVNTAKELAIKYNKKLVAVNHVEGHLLSNLVKNSMGMPERNIEWPAICLTVSGGHTKILEISNPPQPPFDKGGESIFFMYKVIGETLDDAAGEALDKAAKLLGLGYPGGPVIERVAQKGDVKFLELPHPLADKKVLDYSFSGLKTSFYYKIKDWPREKVNENLANLAASFQNAVFETLVRKFKLASEKYQPKSLLACGGVLANSELRKRLRKMARELKLPIYMPAQKYLNTDNASMVGMAGYLMALRGEWADPLTLDRDPRVNF